VQQCSYPHPRDVRAFVEIFRLPNAWWVWTGHCLSFDIIQLYSRISSCRLVDKITAITLELLLTDYNSDHAVATSLVYLTRSMGTVWGVAAVSTIAQAALKVNLEGILPEASKKNELIQEIRRSVDAIRHLSPHLQDLSRTAYFDSVRVSLVFLFIVAVAACATSFFNTTETVDLVEDGKD
jgi:hypothetical protein